MNNGEQKWPAKDPEDRAGLIMEGYRNAHWHCVREWRGALQGATLHLATAGDVYVTNTTTDSNGIYIFTVAPGNYKLWIQPNEPGFSVTWFENTTDINAATVIPVSGIVLSRIDGNSPDLITEIPQC